MAKAEVTFRIKTEFAGKAIELWACMECMEKFMLFTDSLGRVEESDQLACPFCGGGIGPMLRDCGVS